MENKEFDFKKYLKNNLLLAETITKERWEKANEDEQYDMLLTAISDPDKAEKYVGRKFEDLPPEVSSNIYEEETVNEGGVEENTFDPEVARGINSDIRKALDDFYENGDGLELAYAIEGIMFGGVNEEEITEVSEKELEKISDEIEDLADDEELGNLDKVVSAYLKKHPNHKGMETKIRQIASRFVD